MLEKSIGLVGIQTPVIQRAGHVTHGRDFDDVAWDTQVCNQDDKIVSAYDAFTMVAESID
jgi:hypothetical protein